MTVQNAGESMARWYWTSQAELAVLFMERVLSMPVAECLEPVVCLKQAAREAAVEVAFSDKPHANGLPRLFYLRRGQIPGFIGAAREFNRMGWVMRVEDGYRSREMQKFVGRQPAVFAGILQTCIWELAGKTPTAELMTRRCKAMIAYCPKVGTHMSASAIDISLLDRASGQEIDRGGPYLEMSHRTPMFSPFISAPAMANRMKQCQVMRSHGFVEYPYEFWHFNSGDCYDRLLNGVTTPAVYGAVDVDTATGRVTAIQDAQTALNSMEEMKRDIDGALESVSRRVARG